MMIFIFHDICPPVLILLYKLHMCSGYRDGINNNTSVIVKHHLLDSMSPGEHPLRVGT